MTSLLVTICTFVLSGIGSVNADDLFSGLTSDYNAQLFRIDGSNTIGAELAPKLVEEWLKLKGVEQVVIRPGQVPNEVRVTGYHAASSKNLYVDIAAHGSGTGFKALASNTTNIAAASRPIKDSEKALFVNQDLTQPESENVIGIDGLAIILNPQNPVHSLSVDQVRDIFNGNISDWSEVGIGFGAIKLYARDENSGTWDSFKSMVLGKTSLADGALRFESNNELSDLVAKTEGAIGFVGLASVRNAKVAEISAGSAAAMAPSKLTVATEDYALSRRLFMYTSSESNTPFVSDFMDYVAHDGQALVAEVGFVSQDVQAMIPENFADLPADLKDQTKGAYRLSVNFRFHDGSAQLDNKAQRDINRLVSYIDENPGARVLLFGFADENDSENMSNLLSKHRAMAVGRALRKYDIFPGMIAGYGSASPIADVSDAEGHSKNSRVEVWVRQAEKLVTEE